MNIEEAPHLPEGSAHRWGQNTTMRRLLRVCFVGNSIGIRCLDNISATWTFDFAARARRQPRPSSIGELPGGILVPFDTVTCSVRNVDEPILDFERFGNDWIAPISPLKPIAGLGGRREVGGK